MKNLSLVWIFVVGIVVAVLFAFNYQGGNSTIPLSEIFPEEETFPIDVEYEFVDQASDSEQANNVKEPAQAVQIAEKTEAVQERIVEIAKEDKETAVPTEIKKDLLKTEVPFTIQVASFKSKEAAETSLAKVLKKGYEGYVVSRNLGEKGTWHRVYVGVFQDKPKALQELTKVQTDYPGSFVIAPK